MIRHLLCSLILLSATLTASAAFADSCAKLPMTGDVERLQFDYVPYDDDGAGNHRIVVEFPHYRKLNCEVVQDDGTYLDLVFDDYRYPVQIKYYTGDTLERTLYVIRTEIEMEKSAETGEWTSLYVTFEPKDDDDDDEDDENDDSEESGQFHVTAVSADLVDPAKNDGSPYANTDIYVENADDYSNVKLKPWD